VTLPHLNRRLGVASLGPELTPGRERLGGARRTPLRAPVRRQVGLAPGANTDGGRAFGPPGRPSRAEARGAELLRCGQAVPGQVFPYCVGGLVEREIWRDFESGRPPASPQRPCCTQPSSSTARPGPPTVRGLNCTAKLLLAGPCRSHLVVNTTPVGMALTALAPLAPAERVSLAPRDLVLRLDLITPRARVACCGKPRALAAKVWGTAWRCCAAGSAALRLWLAGRQATKPPFPRGSDCGAGRPPKPARRATTP